MPKITSVEPQKKNQHRFNIFLDGEFAFGADEDLVVNRRLVVGKIINPEDLEKILFEAEVGKLMEKMYHWFSLRQHSEKEVRDYFKIKNLKFKIQNGEEISEVITEALIKNMKEKRLIDDRHFAEVWAEARRRSKQKGIRALKLELYQKGIAKDIINEVLGDESRIKNKQSLRSDDLQESSEEDLAKQALEKKMRNWKNLNPQELKQKAFEFLMRKGFEYEIIKNILDKN